MGLNFYYNAGLQPKMRAGIINEHECTYFITKLEHTDLDFFVKKNNTCSIRLSRVFNEVKVLALNTLLNLNEFGVEYFPKKSRSVCSNLVMKYVAISPERLFNIFLTSCFL